jgi:hypothetical protein
VTNVRASLRTGQDISAVMLWKPYIPCQYILVFFQ